MHHPNVNVAQMVQIGQLHMIGKAYLRILCPYVSNLMEQRATCNLSYLS